nr:MAG TPA: hypothetical protein [Caudoviricetes sp.]
MLIENTTVKQKAVYLLYTAVDFYKSNKESFKSSNAN